MRIKLEIHTDGSSRPKSTKCAGWGFVAILHTGEERYELRRYGHLTAPATNNQAELMGAIKALEMFKGCNFDIELYTDSEYVVKGITQYIHNWKKKGWETSEWKSSNKKPVKNAELWKRLDQAREGENVNFIWERGHDGNHYNEIADMLANWGSDRFGVDDYEMKQMFMGDN